MITKDVLAEYVECGREIEFKYQNKMYSITYYTADQKDYISFCEFYKEPTDVKDVKGLLAITQNGVTVQDMWESLSEDDIWVY